MDGGRCRCSCTVFGSRDDDRHKSSRHRSRSKERSRRSRSRSRSRSRTPPRRRRRPTQWDVLPEGGVVPELAAVPPSQVPGALPSFPPAPAVPDMANIAASLGLAVPGIGAASMAAAGMAALGNLGLPMGGGGGGGAGGTAHSQQATRHARRVYVGGLPPTAGEQSVSTFFSHALAAVGGNTAGPGQSVVNVYINKDKNFAFVEFRTVEETSNAMALDGIMFEGVGVRVRRPNDYNPAAAALLGPANPSPTLNLAAIGLGSGGGGGGGGGGGTSAGQDPDRVFVGGLPYYLSDDQCKELLGSFGAIKSFDLVKDRETGNSKGYGFVVYSDPNVTDVACAGLNGLKMGDRTLTVRRAAEGGAGGMGGMAGMDLLGGMAPLPGASRIVVLKNAVEVEELSSPTDYEEIVQDMQDECNKYGTVIKLTIPRPSADTAHPNGLGLVIIEYSDVNAALKAKQAMHGRKFGGHVVEGTFLQEHDYVAGNFSASQ
ncbi:hypothetical protein COO60DRAFT_1291678 [Scenedesmus sp. NREL 46B-D3]|nr:hypothetical protein COO60DRAFT_1291678 [Scenedesmus sp. NREL 46B-D3]